MEPVKCAIVYRIDAKNYSLICSICDKRYYTLKHLVNHVESHFDCKQSQIDINNESCIPESNKITFLTIDVDNHYDGEIKEDSDEEIPPNEIIDNVPVLEDEISIPCNNEEIDIKDIKIYTSMLNNFEDDNTTKRSAMNMQTDTKPTVSSAEHANQQEINHNPFECYLCKKNFQFKKYLSKHMKSMHIKKKQNQSQLIKCPICSKTCKSEAFFVRHQQFCKTEYICSNCPKIFKTYSAFYEHNRTKHTDVTLKKCNECNFTTRYSTNLIRHNRQHTGEKPIVKIQKSCSTENICAKCNKVYKTPNALYKHNRAQHTDATLIKCNECNFTTRYSTNLIRHKRKHTGEKPYTCKLCNKSFGQSSYLNIHMRLHTGVKDLQCSFCGQCFTLMKYLNRHMISFHSNEKEFQCDLCDLKFHFKTNLRKHRITHTGERNYCCEICKKSFARLSTLRQHQLLHADKKKYKCRFCDMNFAQKAGLSGHEKLKHHILTNK